MESPHRDLVQRDGGDTTSFDDVWRGNGALFGAEKICGAGMIAEKKIFPEKKHMLDYAFCITVGEHPNIALPFSFEGAQSAQNA